MQAKVRLPAPGEEVTPFLLRCYVQRGPTRPVSDFDAPVRRNSEAFSLYVWRSATLRDIAILLHHFDPRLSSPTTLHNFRVIAIDSHRPHLAVAREAGNNVSRIGKVAVDDLLSDQEDDDNDDNVEANANNESQETTQSAEKPNSNSKSTYLDTLTTAFGQVDESACQRTLDEIGLVDGEVLDCTISEPRSAMEFHKQAPMTIAGSASRADREQRTGVRRPLPPPPFDAHGWGRGSHDRSESARNRDWRSRRPPSPPSHGTYDASNRREAHPDRDRRGTAGHSDEDGNGPAQWGGRRRGSSPDRKPRMKEDEEPRRRRSQSPRR